MTDQACVVGVDGGNSKTAVAVADLDGRVLASRTGPQSDLYFGGAEGALDALASTIAEALAAADRAPSDVVATSCSLAGADWPEDVELLRDETARRVGLPVPPLVVNDAFGGMRTGTASGEGLAVVCGTFNAVGARHRDGRTFSCGFWPDRTGGFDLGTEALKAVYREGLDLGPATTLTPRALERFGATDPLDLMHRFTRREAAIPAWDAQRLTPILLDCADAGDAVALALVQQSGTWLGEQARVAAARVDVAVDGATVVLSGGVLQHPSTLLADAVLARLPGAVATRPTAPPLVGALLLAYDSLDLTRELPALAASLAAISPG